MEGAHHNCSWVDAREALVPLAEARTNSLVGSEPPQDATLTEKQVWARKWDAAFHRSMAALASDPFVAAQLNGALGFGS